MSSQTGYVYFSLVFTKNFCIPRRLPKRRKYFNMYFMLYVHVVHFNIFLVKQCSSRLYYLHVLNTQRDVYLLRSFVFILNVPLVKWFCKQTSVYYRVSWCFWLVIILCYESIWGCCFCFVYLGITQIWK